MKKRKLLKIAASVFTSVALAAAASISSFAVDETYTLTINGTKTGHTYAAYQIFSGDLDGSTLSNIEWGSGVNSSAIVSALKNDSTIGSSFTEDSYTAAEVAEVLENFSTAQLDAFAQVVGKNLSETATTQQSSADTTTITGLAAGYYLIKDNAAVSGTDASTKFIIKIVKNTTATPKSSVPTVEKKVQDNDDSVTDKWQDVADYSIGDKVPFQLTGTMPSTIGDYDTYKYVFHDTLSDGLTYNSDSIKITIDDTEIANPSNYVNVTGQSLTISFDDIKELATVTANTKVVVTYTATLNTNAVIGLSGNPNEVYLEFSNNPNQGGSGETGTTTKDQVVVFTYELDVTKVDGENNNTKLAGAVFKLKNSNDKWLTVDENGKVSGWVDSEDNASPLETPESGKISIIGLDEGTYSLKETQAPSGYNLLANPIKLVINATDLHDVDYTGSNASAELTAITLSVNDGEAGEGSVDTGIVSTDVENNSGSTLPETGGIGRTIFFVGGGILVLCAAVLLIVKLRKKDEA